jgi:ComF family protein
LGIVLPVHCAGCRSIGSAICDRCSVLLAGESRIVRENCGGLPSLVALGPYCGALRAMVLAIKFRGARSVGFQIGRRLASIIPWRFEAIVPVPLHRSRQRERGFNQAAEIARGIAALHRMPELDDALIRCRPTQPQSRLDSLARSANVLGAFALGPQARALSGRRVLLVDDVITTGATARACAALIREAGAGDVYLAAAALRL